MPYYFVGIIRQYIIVGFMINKNLSIVKKRSFPTAG